MSPGGQSKTHITRIPIDRKFLEELLAQDDDYVADYIEISHEYRTSNKKDSVASSVQASESLPPQPHESAEESFHRAWQTLVIIIN